MEPPFRAVIFDLDGTLVDTPRTIVAIISQVLTELGQTHTRQAVLATVGRPLRDSLAGLLGVPTDHPDVTRAVAAYTARFGQHVRRAGTGLCHPGVAHGLGTLRERGLRLAVATSKVRDAAVATVSAAGIGVLFDAVVGHDSVAHGKPDPDLALHAARLVGVEPRECASVGDAVGDMLMGRAAGMFNVAMTYGVGTEAELRAAGADAVAHSFGEAIDVLLPSPTRGR